MSDSASHLRRVAATGLSALSPGGVGVEQYRAWSARSFAERGTGTVIPDFEPGSVIANPKRLRSMHRTFQLGVAATVLALEAAGVAPPDGLERAGIAPERAGLAAAVPDISPFTDDLLQTVAAAMPAGGGELPLGAFADLALHQLHPFRRLAMLANMAAAHSSLLLTLQGPSFTFTSGAPAGAQTLQEAFWTIAEGRAELMICQAAESPEQCWRTPPVDEVAGAVVLEDWETARRRGAPILAELALVPAAVVPRDADGSPTASLLAAILAIAAVARPGRPGRLSLQQALAAAWTREVPA